MAENENRIVLKTGYYLDNFTYLLDFVIKNYADLLSEAEVIFIENFKSLSHNAQLLYVRLVSRKGPWFILEKILYEEIKSIHQAKEELKDNGFLLKNSGIELNETLAVLTKVDIVNFCKQYYPNLNINYNCAKPNLIDQVSNIEENIFLEKLKEKWTFISPCYSEHIQLFKLLFFGNTFEALSTFILEDIGVLKYEPYQIGAKDRWFDSRILVDDQLFLSKLSEALWVATENQEIEVVEEIGNMLQAANIHENLKEKKEKLLTRTGQYFEKAHLLEEALHYYSLASNALAWERKIRVLSKLERNEEALIEIDKLSKSNFQENLLDFSNSFRLKLKKQLAYPTQAQKREIFKSETIEINRQASLRIEDQAMIYYRGLGFTGFYSENTIWTALFGLVFWDIVFMPLKGAFFNPFQRGPADLFTPGFKAKREEEIAQIIERIKTEEGWKDRVIHTYEEKYLTANFLVSWNRISKKQIQDLVQNVPDTHICLILTRMASKLSDFSSGFPDLLLFSPGRHKYQLVEVKGPGDQLRPNQKRWLRFFQKNDIPYFVTKVRWL